MKVYPAEKLFREAANLHVSDPEKAAELYQQVLTLKPDHANCLYNLHVMERDTGALNSANEYLHRAMHANPNHSQFKEARVILDAMIANQQIKIPIEDPKAAFKPKRQRLTLIEDDMDTPFGNTESVEHSFKVTKRNSFKSGFTVSLEDEEQADFRESLFDDKVYKTPKGTFVAESGRRGNTLYEDQNDPYKSSFDEQAYKTPEGTFIAESRRIRNTLHEEQDDPYESQFSKADSDEPAFKEPKGVFVTNRRKTIFLDPDEVKINPDRVFKYLDSLGPGQTVDKNSQQSANVGPISVTLSPTQEIGFIKNSHGKFGNILKGFKEGIGKQRAWSNPSPTVPMSEGDVFDLSQPKVYPAFFEKCVQLGKYETILWAISQMPVSARKVVGKTVVYWAGIAHKGIGERLLAQYNREHK